ncbi:MAG: hypothetical protein HY756_10905 [Nitrospirae bacterium]|nr:hypothetical protein [Nitrospirota bacterium]
MNRSKFLVFMGLILAVIVVAWSFNLSFAQNSGNLKEKALVYHGKVTPAERRAAGARFKEIRLKALREAATRGTTTPYVEPAAKTTDGGQQMRQALLHGPISC